jgi:multidrug efflux pump subunit AcrA (membrane-fusion protein)
MTTGDLFSAQVPADDAWQEIELLLEETAQLARSGLAPREFSIALLDRLIAALAAAGGAVWSLEDGQRLGIEYQVNLQAPLGTSANDQQRHAELIAGMFQAGEAQLLPPHSGDGLAANPSEYLVLLGPVRLEGETIRVIEVLQRPESRPAVQRGYLRVVAAACEIAEDFHRRGALADLRKREIDLANLADYSRKVHASLDLQATAYNIANEARRQIGCERVSVLSRQGAQVTVLAASGVDALDRRATPVVRLRELARRVLPLGETLWYPSDEALPPQIEEALEACLDASSARVVALAPLIADEESGETIGFLAAERFDAAAGEDWRRRVTAACAPAALALRNAQTYDRIPLRRVWQAMGGVARTVRWPGATAIVGGVLVAIAALVLIPAEFRIEARGELLPQIRRHIFAPIDGVVIELPSEERAHVAKGEVLARLRNPALDIQFSEIVGKRRTTAEELRSAESSQLVAQPAESETARREAAARIQQLKEALSGLDEQYRILKEQQKDLVIRSPIDGVVLTWDVERLLASRPVQQGEDLLTVADLAGPWELELQVPDRQIGHILAARAKQKQPLEVTFRLGTDPGVEYRGQVVRIAATTAVDANRQATVRVTASTPREPIPGLRPGATAIAKVACGRRSLGYVWLHEIWETLQTRLWL